MASEPTGRDRVPPHGGPAAASGVTSGAVSGVTSGAGSGAASGTASGAASGSLGGSAAVTLSRGQRVILVALVLLVAVGLLIRPHAVLLGGVALVTVLYLTVLAVRIQLLWRSSGSHLIQVAEDEARAIPDEQLPVYTVLVPAYGEPEVMPELVAGLAALDYPHDKLDVKLLLEADDEETIAAARAAAPPAFIEIVRIPPTPPRTKPKALNVGLAGARGALVTIYDAEDRPDPLQLRRAVVAFRRLDPSVVCLQAKLLYHNVHQNLITKWFSVEYAMWFSQLLPGLAESQAPIPLGGTSNHFRREVLAQLGGWEPYNVTEDADLGLRLHRAGYRTGVLDSVTYEEANSDFVNWVKQRSRWYKGYMQTWLVHMRQPLKLWSDLGTSGFAMFNLFIGGTPLLALVNPIFWLLAGLWFAFQLSFIQELFPSWLYYSSLFSWVVGNFLIVYTNMVSARTSGHPRLVLAALISPAYWAMMSVAAVKALVQLAFAASFWEKTTHGLASRQTPRYVPNPGITDGAG